MNEVSIDVESRRAIEAIVMVATEPVEPGMLAQLLEIPTARVEEICAALADEYEREGRGFVMVRVAGGYRFQTHADLAPYVERFVLDGRHARLSGAALETLAIVAYKQPISRAQLGAIRGVNVDATLRTLLQRGYVTEVGHEHTLGSPALFGTTPLFLERLGLDSLQDLPALADFVPEARVMEALERGLRIAPDGAAPGVSGSEHSHDTDDTDDVADDDAEDVADDEGGIEGDLSGDDLLGAASAIAELRDGIDDLPEL